MEWPGASHDELHISDFKMAIFVCVYGHTFELFLLSLKPS